MRTSTRITAANQKSFAIGTRVRFNYGAMFPTEEGRITGYGATQWGAFLTAETDAGQYKTIDDFTNMGIGVYLIDAKHGSKS